jgi:IS5 family transposase
MADRLVSWADPDARPIQQGKWGRPVPWGYQVPMIEAEAGFVTDDPVEPGHPADVAALGPALDRHPAPCGRAPDGVATDRGDDRAANEADCGQRGIRTIAIPQRGKKSRQRQRHARQRAFRRAQRWRAGGEGTMSRLKRRDGLRRSRYRGREPVTIGVGLGIFAHHVRRWAQRRSA